MANCQSESCEDSVLLQIPPEPLMPVPNCELPKTATWTKVQIPQVEPYWLAVYPEHDYLSREVRATHTWEDFRPEDFGSPGHAIDIGANLGFFTFALAKSGWNVTSFEPMPENQALFKASLCANPDVVEQIDLHEVGLGDANQHCYLVAPGWNRGDGYVSCGNDTNPVIRPDGGTYTTRGQFDMKVLDEEMNQLKFAQRKVDFVKIDVEGYECHVFKGAKKLLAQKPRLIRTETKGHMADCNPFEYIQIFLDASYKVKTDAKCQNEAAGLPFREGQTGNFFMCLEDTV